MSQCEKLTENSSGQGCKVVIVASSAGLKDLDEPPTRDGIVVSPADDRECDSVADASASSTWDTASWQGNHSWHGHSAVHEAVAEAATEREKPHVGSQRAFMAPATIEKIRREPGQRECSKMSDAEFDAMESESVDKATKRAAVRDTRDKISEQLKLVEEQLRAP